MADDRLYFKVHVGLPENLKVANVGSAAAWLYVCSMAYCARNMTDGVFPTTQVPKLTEKATGPLTRKLLAEGLWHGDGHACPRCAQPGPRHYVIHDYLEHQRSAAQVRAMKEQRRAAGRRGGQARAQQTASEMPSNSLSKAPSKTQADLEGLLRNPQTDPASTASGGGARKRRATPPPDTFPVEVGMYAWAAEQGLSRQRVDAETARFLDHHRAKGSTFKDWRAAWRYWMSHANDYAPRVQRLPSRPSREDMPEALR